MAIPNVPEVDYLEEARERVTEQFKGKDIFDRYLQLLIDQQESIQQVFKDLLQKRSIDEATGATLDIIGEIVGQPRELIAVDLFNWFSFQGVPIEGSFGDLDNSTVGNKFWDLDLAQSGNVLMDDETYRLFIKAKILKNTTASTPIEFINFIKFIFGGDYKVAIAEGQAEFSALIGKELSPFEQSLLTYVSSPNGYPSRFIPKTVGVKVNYGYFDSDNYFGFDGAPNAQGFGDLISSPYTGKFATFI